jgi:ABC-type multidrug transport system permease subunit
MEVSVGQTHAELAWVGCSGRGPYLKAVDKMTFLWILLGIIYVACWVYFGLATFRKGHYWMFWIGFFLPFLWIIGALISPTPRAARMA